jgi:hypothetical protein
MNHLELFSAPNFLSMYSVNVATGITVVLLTSWLIWRSREKLNLSYTVTESDIFPFHNANGKYYAIKISNNGGKLIKSITVDISLTEGEIDQITNHDLMSNLLKEPRRLKFDVSTLNPKEDISFIITSKVTEESELFMKVRGEGVNGSEKEETPSKADLTGTALVFTLVGFCIMIIFSKLTEPSNNEDTRLKNIYVSLNKAGLPEIFNKIMVFKDNPTYKGTAYNIVDYYLQDSSKSPGKYIVALQNLSECEMSKGSKAVIYYLIFKLETKVQYADANMYLKKCKEEDEETYNYLLSVDKNYLLGE